MNYQSGSSWEDNEIEHVQLQHDRSGKWFLIGITEDGSVESAKISKRAARILLANGFAFGN